MDPAVPRRADDELLAVARRCFAELGYVGTSVREIARRAGVDPALVRYYFVSKDDLFDRCLEPPAGFVEGARAACASPLPTRGRTIVRYLLDSWEDEVVGAHLRSLYLSAAVEPRVLARVSGFFSGAMRQAVTDGLAGTELSDVEKDERAGVMTAHLVGLATARYLWRLEPTASMSADRVVQLVGESVQGYLSAP